MREIKEDLVLRCSNGHKVGEFDKGNVGFAHKGRLIYVCPSPIGKTHVMIQCDKCGECLMLEFINDTWRGYSYE